MILWTLLRVEKPAWNEQIICLANTLITEVRIVKEKDTYLNVVCRLFKSISWMEPKKTTLYHELLLLGIGLALPKEADYLWDVYISYEEEIDYPIILFSAVGEAEENPPTIHLIASLIFKICFHWVSLSLQGIKKTFCNFRRHKGQR